MRRKYLPCSQWAICFCVANIAEGIPTSSIMKPHHLGVDPSRIELYDRSFADESFRCIKSSKVTIPFSAVNDDYCDCPDG